MASKQVGILGRTGAPYASMELRIKAIPVAKGAVEIHFLIAYAMHTATR